MYWLSEIIDKLSSKIVIVTVCLKLAILMNKFTQELEIIGYYWFLTNKFRLQSSWTVWNEQFQQKSLRNKNLEYHLK